MLIDGPFRRVLAGNSGKIHNPCDGVRVLFIWSRRLREWPIAVFVLSTLAADQVIAQLTMPLGTSSEITEQAVRHLEHAGEAIRDD